MTYEDGPSQSRLGNGRLPSGHSYAEGALAEFLGKESADPELARAARFLEFLERADDDTGRHLARMGYYSAMLYQRCGLSDSPLESVRLAAMLHDIGKICTPIAILTKQGPLSQAEWQTMQRHPEEGYQLLAASASPILQLGARVARSHHERWDGAGYPFGLKGERIPLIGRIVALADVFDALLSRRCYKRAWSLERTLTVIREGSGRHFDPELVQVFLAHIDDFLAVRAQLSRSP